MVYYSYGLESTSIHTLIVPPSPVEPLFWALRLWLVYQSMVGSRGCTISRMALGKKMTVAVTAPHTLGVNISISSRLPVCCGEQRQL